MVSMPSGMITIMLVPTRTPIPTVDIRRSCEGVRETASGSIPAAKDLLRTFSLLNGTAIEDRWGGSIRYGHYDAQKQ